METPTELVTVFRSADTSAGDDAEQVCDLLVEAGLTAIVVDDSEPGVVEGCWEVRVPASQAEHADQVIAASAAAIEHRGNPSDDLDLIPLFEEGTDLTELEAMNLKTLLEANGIPTVVVGSSQLPNIPFEVRVPQDQLEAAEQVVADASAAATATDFAEEPPAGQTP